MSRCDEQALDRAESDAVGGDMDAQERVSQAKLLVELAREEDYWHDGDAAYATIQVEDHYENHAVKSEGFQLWLVAKFWRTYQKPVGRQALQDALGVLAGTAIFDGDNATTGVRVAQHGDAIYLDLCDESWRAVKIAPGGWSITADPPIKFIRRRAMLPLPAPVAGGSVNELRKFLNVQDGRDFVLLVAWMLGALRGRGPFPLLGVYGEQGSGKSNAQKLIRALVDPNRAPLRSEPREPRDLMIAATNSLVVGFDNLSQIRQWLSDSLCRLSTGGGFSTRELYSNGEEMIFEAMRPVLFNGIEDVATRPDLLDRSILVTLMQIAETDRKAEADLWQEFLEARPRILGALLDAVAAGMANIATVKLDRLPRMADFAKWVIACEPALPWAAGSFIDAYMNNRASANDSALEASSIGAPILKLVEERGGFEGLMRELLGALEATLAKDRNGSAKTPADWPKSSRALSGEVRRIAPNLRAAGVDVIIGKHTKHGTPLVLEQKRKTPSPSSPASPAPSDRYEVGDGEGDDARLPTSPTSSPVTDGNTDACAGGDDGDGILQPCSAGPVAVGENATAADLRMVDGLFG